MLPTVRTFMDSETHALGLRDDIHEALDRLIDEGVTGAPVVDDTGHIVGMLSELECLRLLTHGDAKGTLPGGLVQDYMTPVGTTVAPDTDLYFVAGLFLHEPTLRRFPVVEGQRLVGVITRKDILRALQHRTG